MDAANAVALLLHSIAPELSINLLAPLLLPAGHEACSEELQEVRRFLKACLAAQQ